MNKSGFNYQSKNCCMKKTLCDIQKKLWSEFYFFINTFPSFL